MPKTKLKKLKKSSKSLERDTAARNLFSDFSAKNAELANLEKKYAENPEPEDEATISGIKKDIKNINKGICELLAAKDEGFPVSITQDMLIEWCRYVFSEFHQLSNIPANSIELQKDFTKVITTKDFFDRLVFGKGNEIYDENSKKASNRTTKR